eukprot:13758700-Alexandrium_andersonii.AAC.1
MSASLVGSEMCIRDSILTPDELQPCIHGTFLSRWGGILSHDLCCTGRNHCLLYTSDAADDM